MSDLISVEQDGPVARVRLERPDRLNAQTPAMWHELRHACEGLAAGGEVRCLVLSGAGRSFSAGLDRDARACGEVTGTALSGRAEDPVRVPIEEADIEVAQRAFRAFTEAPFVTVAAVRGHALGAGMELALSCDLRVLADDAQLALPEVELGMMPDMGGCERVAALAGYARAVDLALTCRRIGAAEAHAMGLATAVVPAAELDDRVDRLAGLLAGRPPEAIRYVKLASAVGARGARDESFALAREGALALMAFRERAAAR